MKIKSKAKSEALEKASDVMRLQGKALSTEDCYLHWIGSFIDWLVSHGRDFPDSRARIEGYLTSMAHLRVAASTQNQAFNAIRFFYEVVRHEKIEGINALRCSRPVRLRTALSRENTLKLLESVQDVGGYPTRLVARLLYGCGMRLCEPLNLRVKDVDEKNYRLILRETKFGKDRVTPVPKTLMPELIAQIHHARVVWQSDQLRNLPVQLPGELAKKYKNAPFSWQWAFVFPAHHPCIHPRTGEKVRYRMHEANVQRAVRDAATLYGLEYLATPHVLRHCWATHVIDAGANIRDVQERLGHKSVETTMGYIQPDASRIPSVL